MLNKQASIAHHAFSWLQTLVYTLFYYAVLLNFSFVVLWSSLWVVFVLRRWKRVGARRRIEEVCFSGVGKRDVKCALLDIPWLSDGVV